MFLAFEFRLGNKYLKHLLKMFKLSFVDESPCFISSPCCCSVLTLADFLCAETALISLLDQNLFFQEVCKRFVSAT